MDSITLNVTIRSTIQWFILTQRTQNLINTSYCYLHILGQSTNKFLCAPDILPLRCCSHPSFYEYEEHAHSCDQIKQNLNHLLSIENSYIDQNKIELKNNTTSYYHTTNTIFGKDQRTPATGYISYPTLSASLTHYILQWVHILCRCTRIPVRFPSHALSCSCILSATEAGLSTLFLLVSAYFQHTM